MRLFFMICLVTCLVTAFAPAVTDESGDRAPVAALLVAPPAAAHPVLLVMEPPATPTPKPTPRPPTPRPATPRPATPEPTPVPTPTPITTPVPTPTPPSPTPTLTPSPSPKPSPTTSPTTTTYTRAQVKDGIRRAWGDDDDEAIAVADCESGLNPRATNGPNLGLWQFRIETWRNYGGSGDPRDHSPEVQTRVAWRLYSERGWAPWPGCT